MTDLAASSLEAYCRAIASNDTAELDARRRAFLAHNWRLITVIDQVAQANFAAGDFTAAQHKLALLEQFLPETPGIFLRRVAAAARAGVPGAIAELAGAGARLSNDQEFFHCVEELLAHGYLDRAEALVAECAQRPVFSSGIIAAARSRVLATGGCVAAALEVVEAESRATIPNLTAMRCYYLLLENLLRFDTAQAVATLTALRWRQERDLRHAVQSMLYMFDTDRASKLVHDYRGLDNSDAGLADQLNEQIGQVRAEANAAVALHGPPQGDAPDAIHAALSEPATPPARIVWGKLSLAALLAGGRMTEADYIRFAWFLPNWEQAPVRQRVLAAARRGLPQAPSVQRGWLNHLVANAYYGDAALHCRDLLQGVMDEDTLFLVIVLLRLQQDRIATPFMPPALFETLRGGLLARIAGTLPGFRCVMHAHFVALGWQPQPWPDDGLPSPADYEKRGFRRLFAMTTGRLNCKTTSRIVGRADRAARPVLAFSGQLRGFEIAWPSLRDHLWQPTAAPVVMSVWDKSANAKGRHARRLERMLPDDVVARLKPEERFTDTFEAAYPNTARLLFGEIDVDAAALRGLIDAAGCDVLAVETESERMIAQILPAHVSPNMLKMYYKFARLEALIRQAELDRGSVFTHVIWARPDCEILRLAGADLLACLARDDVAWSSFVTETSFGDYCMVLPRYAFATLSTIFARVCLGGDTRILPWRPNRSVAEEDKGRLDGLGGPDVFFDVLLAAGYMPVSRISRMTISLRGYTPGNELIKQQFMRELSAI